MPPCILIVEDDPVSREVIASLLTSRGYEADVAADGFTGLRMAQDKNYNLVLIDYHLPEMDGYALARLMRSLGEKSNAALKMVAITADHFGLAARRGTDKIFDCVLSKPIGQEDLFEVVEKSVGAGTPLATLESFLAPEHPDFDENAPGLKLWRAQGFDRMPTARVFPQPAVHEREQIESCFRIKDTGFADCVLLLRSSGLSDVASMRCEEEAYLAPLIVLDSAMATNADAVFEPGNVSCWTKAAEVLAHFDSRRLLVAEKVASDPRPETRLAAYMFVADRAIELHRSSSGQTIVPYTAGFKISTIVEAIKGLAARGLVIPKLESRPHDDSRRLVVRLAPEGIRFVTAGGAGNAVSCPA